MKCYHVLSDTTPTVPAYYTILVLEERPGTAVWWPISAVELVTEALMPSLHEAEEAVDVDC